MMSFLLIVQVSRPFTRLQVRALKKSSFTFATFVAAALAWGESGAAVAAPTARRAGSEARARVAISLRKGAP